MASGDYQWVFGELKGPSPAFDEKHPENCELVCLYRRKPRASDSKVEERLVHFSISAESRVKMNNYATADGVDALLRELVQVEQSNFAQFHWEPQENVLIHFSRLEQLNDARDRAKREDQRVPDYGEL
jgi:hypothetical protein